MKLGIEEISALKAKLGDASLRRRDILDPMQKRFADGKNCSKCLGHCCTSEFNSMQVTPIQALDLYFYLEDHNRINQSLIDALTITIKKFRLDYCLPTGKGGYFRRTYTCPFYTPSGEGCSVSPESKPYGCLAFNPLERGVISPGYCTSDQSLLEKRESMEEDQLNQVIRDELKLYWEKESVPVALLNLIDLFK